MLQRQTGYDIMNKEVSKHRIHALLLFSYIKHNILLQTKDGTNQSAISASNISNYFLASDIIEILTEIRRDQMSKIVKQVAFSIIPGELCIRFYQKRKCKLIRLNF